MNRKFLEDALVFKIRGCRKESEIESDTANLEELEKQLESTRSTYTTAKAKLYACEVTLPLGLKDRYDTLRKNPKWYMRQGLVDDCAAQGGCCSRECGCCEQRSLSKKKGQGHCTIDCWCCSNNREHSLTTQNRVEIARTLIDVRLTRYEYLERMGNWYFDPLRVEELQNTENSKPKEPELDKKPEKDPEREPDRKPEKEPTPKSKPQSETKPKPKQKPK